MGLTLERKDYTYGYYNGGGEIGGYDNYSATTHTGEPSHVLAQRFIEKAASSNVQLVGNKVLVLGCAYGYLVQYLYENGVDAYGMDWSEYAISRTPETILGRTVLGDARNPGDWQAARQAAQLAFPSDKFTLVIDESMFCCMSDQDAVSTKNIAFDNSLNLYHLVDIGHSIGNWYNYHDLAGWKSVVGFSDNEKWYSRFFWAEQ